KPYSSLRRIYFLFCRGRSPLHPTRLNGPRFRRLLDQEAIGQRPAFARRADVCAAARTAHGPLNRKGGAGGMNPSCKFKTISSEKNGRRQKAKGGLSTPLFLQETP